MKISIYDRQEALRKLGRQKTINSVIAAVTRLYVKKPLGDCLRTKTHQLKFWCFLKWWHINNTQRDSC